MNCTWDDVIVVMQIGIFFKRDHSSGSWSSLGTLGYGGNQRMVLGEGDEPFVVFADSSTYALKLVHYMGEGSWNTVAEAGMIPMGEQLYFSIAMTRLSGARRCNSHI